MKAKKFNIPIYSLCKGNKQQHLVVVLQRSKDTSERLFAKLLISTTEKILDSQCPSFSKQRISEFIKLTERR